MKTLIKWAVKKFATVDCIKNYIHAANAALAEKEAGERTQRATAVCNEICEVTVAYASAYANDGKIDADELAKVNAACDTVIDRYVTDATIEAVIDAMFA